MLDESGSTSSPFWIGLQSSYIGLITTLKTHRVKKSNNNNNDNDDDDNDNDNHDNNNYNNNNNNNNNNTNDQYIIIMLSILLGSKYSKFLAWECDTVINVSNN